jgi:hypothetical protein
MVFENRAQRNIFVPNRDDVTGQWRRLHNEKIITSGNVIRVIISRRTRGGTCGTYGDQERSTQGLVGSPEGNRPLGRPRLKWKDKFKLDLQDVG